MVQKPRQAIVLAAGEATRLKPLTSRRPKGMLLAGGRPILQYQIQALQTLDIDHATIVVGPHAEKIQSFFKDGQDFGLRIDYAQQTDPTGTADAVRAALPHVDTEHPLLILMGDNWLTKDTLRPLTDTGANAILLAPSPVRPGYGIPTMKNGGLARIETATDDGPEGRVSTGILHAGPDLLAELADDDAHDLHAFLNDHLTGTESILPAVDAAGPWHDVTTPWDLLRLNERILGDLPNDGHTSGDRPTIQGAVRIGRDTTIAPTATLVGPVTIGDGCTIGDYTVVGPYASLRTNTTIEAHCEVRRSILNNNVLVGSRSLLRGSILDDGARVGPGFAVEDRTTPEGVVGCVLGADTHLGPDCRVASGTLVEPETETGPGERVA